MLHHANSSTFPYMSLFVSLDLSICLLLETRYYPNSMATEVLLGIPPIDIVVQNISAKFVTKVLQYHDHLRKRGI